jgi:hypothetical protein
MDFGVRYRGKDVGKFHAVLQKMTQPADGCRL